MSVNSITISYAAMCFSSGTTITEETRKKLLALGIDPSTVKTEAEAKQKIEEAIISKKQNNANSKSGGKGSKSESKIISEAKILASLAGACLSMTDNTDEILDKTSDAIDKMDDTDPRKRLLKERLLSLESEYASVKSSSGMLENLMSYDAVNNKIALGL